MAGLASQCWGAFYRNGEAQMRKALIALVATLSLVLVGVLVAAPKMTNSARNASMAGAGLNIFDLTQKSQELSEQSY